MEKYTIELRRFEESCNVFNFEYNFYDDELKHIFEDLFFDHYYDCEIGFETRERFQRKLRSKLNIIMPYYTQLYKSELEAEKINFLLNKDLKETFIRDITGNTQTEDTGSNKSNSNTGNKESYLENGNATLNDLTGITDSTSSVSASMNGTSKSQSIGSEKTELISQGNIGVTSSAELLEKWRSTFLNINQLIIKECHDLFMMIY